MGSLFPGGWGDGFDLEDGRPLFACYEEAVAFGVVGDAVEDGFGVDFLGLRGECR